MKNLVLVTVLVLVTACGRSTSNYLFTSTDGCKDVSVSTITLSARPASASSVQVYDAGSCSGNLVATVSFGGSSQVFAYGEREVSASLISSNGAMVLNLVQTK
jgi:hypothetical protein